MVLFYLRISTSQIPNIVGHTGQGGACNSSAQVNVSGAFTPTVPNAVYYKTGTDRYNSIIYFNAAYCNWRYGDYTEVNPLYESCKFFIRY